MSKLEKFNNKVFIIDKNEMAFTESIRKFLKELSESVSSFEELAFCIMSDDRFNYNSLYNNLVKSFKNGIEYYEADIFPPRKLLETYLKINGDIIYVIDESSWTAEDDLITLVKIDRFLNLRKGFGVVLWIRTDWNEAYRRKFHELLHEGVAFWLNDQIIDENYVIMPKSWKIRLGDAPNLRKRSLESFNSILNEARARTTVPSNIYSPKKRTPELYDELIDIFNALQEMGYWEGRIKIEDFYRSYQGGNAKKTLERKVNLLRHILSNPDTFDFLL